ncbi:MAG: cadherin-like beta sandwich domain-containing protein [Nitrospira sp.]|nr:cadherin-like beta sandwich domain-containing protein [Nitrospira sp.]
MHYEKWSNMTMKGILTLAGQRLTAALIIAISFSVSGCMGSASVNPVAELASLTVTPGTLQPAFTSETTQYTVDLTREVTSVRLTAQPAVAGDTITINGQATTSSTITLGPEGSTTSVSIVVSESSNNSRTYIVLLKRASLAGNNSLLSLIVSTGTLAPGFNANTQNYTVDVANNVDSVTVTPTLQDSAATVTVNGQATNSGEESQPIQLGGTGSSTPIDIVVTAQNGSQKTYHVTVNRGESGNNFLQSLAISPGTLDPPFNAGTEGYTVNLPSILPGNPSNMTVTPTLQDATASMTVNGQPATSGQAQPTPLPAPGANTAISIVVTAQNNTKKTYTVTVIRAALNGNNFLSALNISPGTLTPVFNAGTEGYTVNLPSILPGNPSNMTVTPTLQDATASMTVNGQPATSGQAQPTPLPAPGANTAISIVVTAQNNTKKTYTVTVIRAALNGNNFLSALNISPGTLTPVFNAGTEGYTVNLPSILPGNPSNMTVTPTLQDATASMTVNGQPATSGQTQPTPLPTSGSATFIAIVVTAQNGTTKTYSINVTRAALSGNNKLESLAVSPGILAPTFNASTTSYTVNVATEITSVTVTATLSDTNASMMINGQGTSSGQARDIDLEVPGPTAIEIIVTAPNGSQETYTITVNQAASSNSKLLDLTVSSGSAALGLTPVFNPDQLSYTVDVDNSVSSVVISATKADPQATMSTLGSVIAAPGVPGGQVTVTLGVGPTTEVVTITVIAQDMASQSLYTVTVNKAP